MFLKISYSNRELMITENSGSAQDVILTAIENERDDGDELVETNRVDVLLTREDANRLARRLLAFTS